MANTVPPPTEGRSLVPPKGTPQGIVRTITIRPARAASMTDRPAAGQPSLGTGRVLWDMWMVVLGLASLGIIGWVEYYHISWPHPTFRKLANIDLAIVLFCLAEWVIRLTRAPVKKAFVRQNWIDLIGLIPMYVETFALLRAARLIRVVRVARALRIIYTSRRLLPVFGFLRRVLQESRLGYSFSIFGIVVVAMAAAFWSIEHSSNQQLVSFDDALWWSLSTAATVGYGDIAPTTGYGRIIAMVLMLFGLTFVGVITSSLSAALVFVADIEATEEIQPSMSAELTSVCELREKGFLSEDEFLSAKRKILGG